jgi:hypothetical protein
VTVEDDGLSRNGRPLRTHERSCDTELHAEHLTSLCPVCGCCWGCEPECCAEYACPNPDCGCHLTNKPSGDDRQQPWHPASRGWVG